MLKNLPALLHNTSFHKLVPGVVKISFGSMLSFCTCRFPMRGLNGQLKYKRKSQGQLVLARVCKMFCLLSLTLLAGIASAINLKVSASGGNASSPLMYGLMFEDISHSGDGGIYAELIQNRAFQGSIEYPSTLTPWVPIGGAILTLQNTSIPLSKALPTSIKVSSANSTKGTVGILNPGWWGIDVKPQKYTGSFWVLGSYRGKFTVKLQSNLTNQVFASLDIPSSATSGKWVEHKFELEPKAAAPNSNNTFVLEFDSKAGSLNFNLISLFPPTYNNRPNGNRPDLMEALEDLSPSFFRIPGGNNMSDTPFFLPSHANVSQRRRRLPLPLAMERNNWSPY